MNSEQPIGSGPTLSTTESALLAKIVSETARGLVELVRAYGINVTHVRLTDSGQRLAKPALAAKSLEDLGL